MSNLLVTEIDEFFDLVKERGEMTIEEVCDIMETEVELVERWAKTLSEVGMMALDYPIFHYDTRRVKIKVIDPATVKSRNLYPLTGLLP